MAAESIPAELLEARREIDELDREIVSLLAKRFAVTKRVGQLKASQKLDVVDPDREARKLDEIRSLCQQYDLNSEMVSGLFVQIMAEAVRNHRLAKQASD